MVKGPRKPPKPLLTEDKAPLRSGRLRPRDPEQPRLLFDPMPDRVEPCLAVLKNRPPKGSEWSYDIKWDGYRISVHRELSKVRILTRGGFDWTERFPAIASAAAALGPATFILDGEAVVLDEMGRSDFGLLQGSLGGRTGKHPAATALMFAFDLMYLDGHDLRKLEFAARRHILEDLLDEATGAIRLSEEINEDPERLIEHACALGLEGIIGKHRDRPYRPGKTGDWIKIKCVQRESFAILGYELSSAMPDGFGSLLLGALRGGEYVYVGSVGTGFTHQQARALRKQLDKLKTNKPVIRFKEKTRIATDPGPIAEIDFRGWTSDGKLRHASFKGLRDPEDAAAVYSLDVGDA